MSPAQFCRGTFLPHGESPLVLSSPNAKERGVFFYSKINQQNFLKGISYKKNRLLLVGKYTHILYPIKKTRHTGGFFMTDKYKN